MWKYLFQNHILGRGLDYFMSNLVENVYVKDNIVKATVYGTREYRVAIVKDDDEIIGLTCNCPHADDGNNCKHMAAVLFYLEDKKDVLKIKDVERDISKLIKSADSVIIQDFLADILINDEKLLNRFRSRLNCDITLADMSRYKNQINSIFRKYAGRHDFVDYENAWGFISNLAELLNNDIEVMIGNNQLNEAFELTSFIFIKVGNQDIDDSDGGTSQLADKCLEIWSEILDNSNLELKRKMYNWFTEHLNDSVIDHMEDYIEEIIFAEFKEAEFMEKKITFLDDKIREYKKEKSSWPTRYYLGKMLLRRIDIMKEMKVDQSIIEDYCKKNLDIKEAREYLIDICLNRKDYDMAIKLLVEGKKIEKDWPGIILDYSLKLKDLYKKVGENKLYKEELWTLVLTHKAGNVELYKELRSLYTNKKWLEKREIIFNKLSPYGGIDKLYELEGLYDKLISLVVNSRGLYLLMEYEDVLKDIYPKELFQKYENAVKDMATNTSGRSRYREIVSILRRMKKYPKGKEKVSELVSDWRLRYRNRPAMMDELNKL